MFSFGDSIGQGTNSIMSRFIGSGDYESAYNSLIHGMILSNIVWVFLVFCLLFANRIKIPLIFALISMVFALIRIFTLPFRLHECSLIISAAASLVGGTIGIYLMERLDKPLLSVFGFILVAVVLFIFMGKYSYLAVILFVITGILIMFIKIVLERLNVL